MNNPAGNNEGGLRIAYPEDILFLVNHPRKMFEGIQETTGNPVDLPARLLYGKRVPHRNYARRITQAAADYCRDQGSGA